MFTITKYKKVNNRRAVLGEVYFTDNKFDALVELGRRQYLTYDYDVSFVLKDNGVASAFGNCGIDGGDVSMEIAGKHWSSLPLKQYFKVLGLAEYWGERTGFLSTDPDEKAKRNVRRSQIMMLRDLQREEGSQAVCRKMKRMLVEKAVRQVRTNQRRGY